MHRGTKSSLSPKGGWLQQQRSAVPIVRACRGKTQTDLTYGSLPVLAPIKSVTSQDLSSPLQTSDKTFRQST